MRTLHFNKLVVIQSLPDDEPHTGTLLHKTLRMLINTYGHDLDSTIYNIDTKKDFMQLLTYLTEEAKSVNCYPVLHIETHGRRDTKGLALSSEDEIISWEELKNPLIELNTATKNNLLIVLAACNGAHLIEIINLTDRAPCWGLIGPVERIRPDVLISSLSAFYREFLATTDVNKALEQLNKNIPKGQGYLFTTAEMFFIKVFKRHIAVSCSKKAIEDRARSIRKKAKKMGATSIPSIGALKRKLARKEEPFEKYKKTFFMTDLYPENEERLTMKFSDVNH